MEGGLERWVTGEFVFLFECWWERDEAAAMLFAPGDLQRRPVASDRQHTSPTVRVAEA